MLIKFALAGALSIAGAAQAVVVPGVYNTGLGVGGSALAAGDGQVDANYVVVSSTNAAIVPGSHALTYYNPAYLADGPKSRIVNPTGNGNGGSGEVTIFATTFSLVGFDSLTATVSGQALFDNFSEIFLNAHQVGGTITGFGTLAPFGTNANFFNAGLNTLNFVVHNIDGPEVFQVAGLTVTAGPGAIVGGVPEPRSWAMMLAGFAMVGATMRRRKATPVVTA